jgi:hypothetical protein
VEVVVHVDIWVSTVIDGVKVAMHYILYFYYTCCQG